VEKITEFCIKTWKKSQKYRLEFEAVRPDAI